MQLDLQQSIASAAAEVASSSSSAPTTHHLGVDAALANARAVTILYNSFKILSQQGMQQIRSLKELSIKIKELKAKHLGADFIPRSVQNQIYVLEGNRRSGFDALSEKIKELNTAMTKFLTGPLSANKSLISLIQKERQILYNELDELQRLTSNGNGSSSGAATVAAVAVPAATPVASYATTHPVLGAGAASSTGVGGLAMRLQPPAATNGMVISHHQQQHQHQQQQQQHPQHLLQRLQHLQQQRQHISSAFHNAIQHSRTTNTSNIDKGSEVTSTTGDLDRYNSHHH